MAYLIYDKNEQHVVSQTSEDPRPDGPASGTETSYLVFEGEIDQETDFAPNYRLNAAGDGLENPYKALSKAEQLLKFQDDHAKVYAVTTKKHLLQLVNSETRNKLDGEYGNTAWKVEKAREQDLINGNTDAMRALALEKQAIRDKGNAIEAEIQALDPSVAADAKTIQAMPLDFTKKFYD